MKLDTSYFAIKKPDNTTVTTIVTENGGLHTTRNKAQSHLNRLLANSKNRLESVKKKLVKDPLDLELIEAQNGWQSRLEDLRTCKVVEVKVVEI